MWAKICAKSAQMRLWRVQEGATEDPKWSQMAQDGGQAGAKCQPKGLREELVPVGARQADAKRRPRVLGTGPCTVLRAILGSKRCPKGAKIGPKSDQK